MINYTLVDIKPQSEYPGYSLASVMGLYQTDLKSKIPMFIDVEIPEESPDDKEHIVTSIDAGRIDLISYKYYNTVDYWWAILLVNSIVDPFALEVGQSLRIPSYKTILNKWLST